MGHQLSTVFSGLGRFFEYPVKRKPICFYRQEDFTATERSTYHAYLLSKELLHLAPIQISTLLSGTASTPKLGPLFMFYVLLGFKPFTNEIGEPRRKSSEFQKPPMTDYDKLVELFYKRLAEQRQYNQEMKEQDRRWSMQKVVDRFPGWNEVTIANLHSLFLLFDNQSNGMLGFDDFSAVLESLGDENAIETRKEKFHEADTDNDGWITYDEFLSLVYNFDPQEHENLTGLALLCNEVADNIQFVSNLTVGEQLEYGLF